MKHVLLTALVLLLATSLAYADDYLRIDADRVPIGTTAALDFYCTRECPTPTLIKSAGNGFVMTATGPATWTYHSFTPDPTANAWYDLGGMLWSIHIDGTSPDSFWIGGASMILGMPIVTEQKYATLRLSFGSGVGDLCIDSSFVLPAQGWYWSGMTCGQGGAPDRPLFLAKNGSDAIHPICIDVYDPSCPDPFIVVFPPGFELSGAHCNQLTFPFQAYPGGAQVIVGWAVIYGPGIIDADGVYTVGPMPTGTYPVVVEVENDCGGTDDCTFDVIFTNDPPVLIPDTPPIVVEGGQMYVHDFSAVDSDTCDPGIFDVSYADPPPVISPQISPSGLFAWVTDPSEVGTLFTFEVTVGDGEGGSDAHSWQVVVLEPAPLCGDVDLSGGVDIDDVVYLINYIFSGGNAPCDVDGDGVPDC